MKSVINNFCPIPTNIMKMKSLSALLLVAVAMSTVGCGIFGKNNKIQGFA